MPLQLEGHVELPEHVRPEGGFDHAAVLRARRMLYVAHTANDSLDVIDLARGVHVDSIAGLIGVAGALVDEQSERVFSSNRGEDTVSVFPAAQPRSLTSVPVGVRPNGLAFDDVRGRLLVANVGDAARPSSHTLSVLDADAALMIASHTLALDPDEHRVYAFLPASHRAAVFRDVA